MKGGRTTNSHYVMCTFLFKEVGRMYFLSLGVNGLIHNEAIQQLYWHYVSQLSFVVRPQELRVARRFFS